MWKAIIGLVSSLPEIIKVFKKISGLIEKWIEDGKKARRAKWKQKGQTLELKLKNAKDNKERHELLKKISKHNHSLPK